MQLTHKIANSRVMAAHKWHDDRSAKLYHEHKTRLLGEDPFGDPEYEGEMKALHQEGRKKFPDLPKNIFWLAGK